MDEAVELVEVPRPDSYVKDPKLPEAFDAQELPDSAFEAADPMDLDDRDQSARVQEELESGSHQKDGRCYSRYTVLAGGRENRSREGQNTAGTVRLGTRENMMFEGRGPFWLPSAAAAASAARSDAKGPFGTSVKGHET
jgi:hypothetical protein